MRELASAVIHDGGSGGWPCAAACRRGQHDHPLTTPREEQQIPVGASDELYLRIFETTGTTGVKVETTISLVNKVFSPRLAVPGTESEGSGPGFV